MVHSHYDHVCIIFQNSVREEVVGHLELGRVRQVHFVLPVKISEVAIVSGVDDRLVLDSIQVALG